MYSNLLFNLNCRNCSLMAFSSCLSKYSFTSSVPVCLCLWECPVPVPVVWLALAFLLCSFLDCHWVVASRDFALLPRVFVSLEEHTLFHASRLIHLGAGTPPGSLVLHLWFLVGCLWKICWVYLFLFPFLVLNFDDLCVWVCFLYFYIRSCVWIRV